MKTKNVNKKKNVLAAPALVLAISLLSSLSMAANTEVDALKSAKRDVLRIFDMIELLNNETATADADLNAAAAEIKANCTIVKATAFEGYAPTVAAIFSAHPDDKCPLQYASLPTRMDLRGDRASEIQLNISSLSLLGKLKVQVFSYSQKHRFRNPDEASLQGEIVVETKAVNNLSISGQSAYAVSQSAPNKGTSRTNNVYSVTLRDGGAKRVTLLKDETLDENLEPVAESSTYKINNSSVPRAEAEAAELN